MVGASSSETFITTYKIAKCHYSKDQKLNMAFCFKLNIVITLV
jgi:hypothetical protein